VKRVSKSTRQGLCLLTVVSALASGAAAQPSHIGQVWNDAAGPNLAADTIAQGSVFVLSVSYGSLLPSAAAPTFPLPMELGGASIRIAVGGVSRTAPIFATNPFGVRALLPSGVPAGEGSIELFYDGQPIGTRAIQVVPRSFAVYQNPGQMQAAIQDVSLIHPAKPGQVVSLWGTGLGGVEGDEAAGPLPSGFAPDDFRIEVGGIPARVLFAGRSGCCAGVDQIVFEVPPGVVGCFVPVAVRFPEWPSPTVTMAIAEGDTCVDPRGLPREVLKKFDAGTARIAQLNPWGGTFFEYSEMYEYPLIAPGTCAGSMDAWISPFTDDRAKALFDTMTLKLDAGPALNFATPSGPIKAPLLNGYAGFYDSSILDVPVTPGDYRVDNGVGGMDVGPFASDFKVPEPAFAWSNKDELNTVSRQQPLTVRWNIGNGSQGFVWISGSLERPANTDGIASFGYCLERAGKGSLTIPADVLWRRGTESATKLTLFVSYLFDSIQQAPAGLDVFEFRNWIRDTKTMEIGR